VEKQVSGALHASNEMAQYGAGVSYASHPHPVRKYPHHEDALGTIVQWLYDRIEKTR
jgi:hypothetical protein